MAACSVNGEGVEAAVRLGAQADPHAHGGPVDGGLEHLLAGIGDLDRLAEFAGRQRRQGQVVIGLALAAEAAADIAGQQANLGRGDHQGLGQGVLAALHHLDRGVDRDIVTLPPGGGGAGLHLGVVLQRADIGLVQADRGAGEGGLEVADPDILLALGLVGRIEIVFEDQVGGLGRVVEAHQGRGGLGVLERVGGDEAHMLAEVLDPAGQGRVGAPLAAGIDLRPPLALGRHIVRRPDQPDARGGLCGGDVGRSDHALGDWRGDQHPIGRRRRRLDLIGERR